MTNCFLIVNYNDYKSTKHLVDNVIDYKCLDEIVIVDNGSSEEEVKAVSTIKNKKITILYNEENLGYSVGINTGAKYLIDKYEKCNLIISNSDIVILNEEDLVSMLELLSYETIGLVGPQVIERGHISRGWKCPSALTDMLLNIPLLDVFAKEKICEYKDEFYSTPTSVVEAINTCFFIISSDLFKSINYMDENVFLYYEDNILGKKVRDEGKLVIVDNLVKIKHNYSVTVDKNVSVYNRFKMLLESQLYYHTNYNKAGKIKRGLLILSFNIGNFFRSFKSEVKRKRKK